MPQHIKL